MYAKTARIHIVALPLSLLVNRNWPFAIQEMAQEMNTSIYSKRVFLSHWHFPILYSKTITMQSVNLSLSILQFPVLGKGGEGGNFSSTRLATGQCTQRWLIGPHHQFPWQMTSLYWFLLIEGSCWLCFWRSPHGYLWRFVFAICTLCTLLIKTHR